MSAEDLDSDPGCDLFLKREGAQFRGGTRGRECLASGAGEPRWIDYRVVVGEGVARPGSSVHERAAYLSRVAGQLIAGQRAS